MRFALSLSRTAVAALAALAVVGIEKTAAQDAPQAGKGKTETPAPPVRRGPRPGDVQKVFVIKYVDARRMAQILSVFPAEISAAGIGEVQALAVSASQPTLAAIEETIKRLDTPPAAKRNVDVTVQVLECSTRPEETSSTPGELQEVVGQLRRTFNYAGCGLVQTLLGRGREGSLFSSGMPHYDLRWRVDIVPSEGVSIIKLAQFKVVHRDIPTKNAGGGTSMQSNFFDGDIDVRNGQRAVVGKLGTGESGKDEILVVTAKILD